MRSSGFVASAAMAMAMALALALSGCGGSSKDKTAAAPAGTLQLQSAALKVSEGSGAASVLITRTGGSSGAVSATLSIVGGSADIGSDVALTTRMVVFADGDVATKTVTIPLLDDGEDEADEVFTAHLSTVSGGATLGSPASVTITIADDDDANILTHRVAGTVSGLAGTLSLRNNGADELRLEANGAFTFPIQVAEGQPYAVTVVSQPTDQACTVAHASGIMGTTDVIDVAVTCVGGTAPPPPPPTTGVFTGGSVKGLHYRTPSHSGLTDEAGTFTYVPGERVAFSIGGIELGSALGAPQINVFTLLGHAPPTTELALRTEINNAVEDNITDFVQVANRAHLLFALDVDHNGANGIDLGTWDAQLTDADLQFDVPMDDFSSVEFRRFARLHGIAYKFSSELPLVHLYRSLGIKVSTHAIVMTTEAQSGLKRIYELDSEGRVFREVEEEDSNQDGIADSIRTATSSHDGAGNFFLTITEFDSDGDGTVDEKGRFTTTYDAAGNQTSSVDEDDNDADGTPDERETTTDSFDGAGNQTLSVDETDSDADGNTDIRRTTTNTYDVAGNLLTSVFEEDFYADSVIERKVTETYTYDAAGRWLSNTSETEGANGSIEVRALRTFVYDVAGKLSSEKTERDEVGGIADNTIDSVEKLAYAYDAAGNVSRLTAERDANADADVDFRKITTATFDDARRELSVLDEEDGNADTAIDRRVATTNAYDGIGNLLFAHEEEDRNVDGVVDREFIERKVYDVDGNILSAEAEANGVLTSVYAFHYTVLEDGLQNLLIAEAFR
jgi:hypothetical protein